MGDKYIEFAKKFSPSLYRRLKKAGVKNVDAAHDYMLRQLAFESGWGNSAVAKKYNNYAGWGHKVVDGKHVYSQFKDSEDFLDTWVPGMLGRYRSAINAPTLNDYAINLKKKGYYEDSLEHYMQTLNGMGRATRAAAALRQSNPELYADIEPEISVRNFAMLNKPYVQPADNTRVIKPTQIQYNKTLPDTEVIGHRRKALQAPAVASLWDTQKLAIEYNLLKAAGMVPEDDNNDYMNMFVKPTLGLPHFAGGKDGWTPDQGWTVTRRGGKSYVSLGQPKEPTMKRPYWVTARTKQLDYDDLEKGYTTATAGMLPNYLTAARNFVQGDIQEGLVNLGMTADIQLTPDGTTYAVVAPGALDTYANAAKFFNKEFTRMFRTLGPVLTNTDRFVKFLQQRTGKTITRIPIKDSKIGDIYSRGYSYVDENGKEIAHIAGNKKPEGVFVESSYVSPEYRSQGIGKLMYFDFNEHTFNELGSTLRSSPYQHQSTLEIEPGSGIFISPSSKLWRGLKSNGLAEIGGSGLNRYYMMAEPSAINPLY